MNKTDAAPAPPPLAPLSQTHLCFDENVSDKVFVFRRMELEEGDGPEAKRRKEFSKRETLQKLEELGDNVQKAASEMVSDLSPFDVNDQNVEAYDERIEKLDKVATCLAAKIYKLKADVKKRKFKGKPELLDESVISCSQYSVLQSPDMEELSQSLSQESLQDITPTRPDTYRF